MYKMPGKMNLNYNNNKILVMNDNVLIVAKVDTVLLGTNIRFISELFL